MYASVSFATECADECGERNVGIPVCKQADDCINGEPCRAYDPTGQGCWHHRGSRTANA